MAQKELLKKYYAMKSYNIEKNSFFLCWLRCSFIQRMKGAVTRVDPTKTPFPYRNNQWYFDITPQWIDPAEADSLIAWTRSFWAEIEPHTCSTAVNWLSDDGNDRVKLANGPNYKRLARLKHKYDPANFFRLNNNILPDASEEAEKMIL